MHVRFDNSICAYSHPYNLHQKSLPPPQLFFTSLVRPYLLQSSLTLPSSIPQQYFTSIFLRTAIPAAYIKSISPPLSFSQLKLCQVTNEQGSLVRNDTVLIFLVFLKEGSRSLILYCWQSLMKRYCNPHSSLPSTCCH